MNKPEAYSKSENSSTTLVFLRHARTALNAKSFLQGSKSDPPLDEVGIEQAQKIGIHVQQKFLPQIVVSSPLQRARQTLREAGFADTPILEDRFMEMSFGNLEGEPVKGNMSQMYKSWAENPTTKSENGESLQELFLRVSSACEDLVSTKKFAGKTLLVCSHATPIKAAIIWALGGKAEMILRMHIDLASLSVVNQTQYGTIVSGYNSAL